jgi:hypothetical protein
MTPPNKPVDSQAAQACQTVADRRAEDKRKLRAARVAALAVPQNQRVLIELAKR